MQDPDKLQRILETLETSVGEDYPHQDLVLQREALLEFLGALAKRIGDLRNSYGSSYEKRLELFGLVDEWWTRHAPLFPGVIQSSMRVIHASARACLQDYSLDQINSVGASELIAFHWTVIERYEELLRKWLAKTEREGRGRVEFGDGQTSTVPESAVAGVTDGETPDFRCSEGYRSVNLRGRQFELTVNQARVVEKLHRAYQQGTPVLSDAHLLEALHINSDRLRDVFKNSDAWGTLVKKGERQGTRRLGI
jgi:hypothetical protein